MIMNSRIRFERDGGDRELRATAYTVRGELIKTLEFGIYSTDENSNGDWELLSLDREDIQLLRRFLTRWLEATE